VQPNTGGPADRHRHLDEVSDRETGTSRDMYVAAVASLVGDARQIAEQRLAVELPRRWGHVQAVAAKAEYQGAGGLPRPRRPWLHAADLHHLLPNSEDRTRRAIDQAFQDDPQTGDGLETA
jgi:hypothetical protein